MAQFDDEPIAGAFAWERDDLLNIRVTAFETPFQWRFRLGGNTKVTTSDLVTETVRYVV